MAQQRTARQEKNQRTSETQGSKQLRPSKDFVTYLTDYAREKPEVAALWCFGIGFVLGWKMKLW